MLFGGGEPPVEIQAVAGVVATDDEGLLLLTRRASDGAWADPAGPIESGETWAQAAVREFAEETGGVVGPTGLLGIDIDPGTQIPTYRSAARGPGRVEIR